MQARNSGTKVSVSNQEFINSCSNPYKRFYGLYSTAHVMIVLCTTSQCSYPLGYDGTISWSALSWPCNQISTFFSAIWYCRSFISWLFFLDFIAQHIFIVHMNIFLNWTNKPGVIGAKWPFCTCAKDTKPFKGVLLWQHCFLVNAAISYETAAFTSKHETAGLLIYLLVKC